MTNTKTNKTATAEEMMRNEEEAAKTILERLEKTIDKYFEILDYMPIHTTWNQARCQDGKREEVLRKVKPMIAIRNSLREIAEPKELFPLFGIKTQF